MRAGVDLGGTKILAVVVNSRDRVLGQAKVPTPTDGGPPDIADAIAGAVGSALEESGHDASELTAVGIGSPGEIDAEAGTVSQARNLPGWEGTYPLGPEVEKRVGAPVAIGNDVSVATAAEFKLGAGQPYDSILGVFWGTGVGGGIVLDGREWNGRGAAAEIGHMVVKIDGAQCPCGRYGCVEAYAGRASMEARARKKAADGAKTKLFDLMQERGRDRLTAGIWFRALEAGDELAQEIVDRAIKALGAGVASALNLLDVDAVVVGGGLGVKLGEPYAKRIEEAIMPHLFASDRPPALHVAALGDLGGAIGAALLAKRAAAPAAA
jgi:glucokinase